MELIKEENLIMPIVKISNYYKHLDYKKQWMSENKDKVNMYAKLHYIKKLEEEGEEYRKHICEKNKMNYHLRKAKLLEENPDIIIKKLGRPRINEIKIKKANGRPRKYLINVPVLSTEL
jgi:hypothetical protein